MTRMYLLIGMAAFWSVFLTLIFRLEKRMVWPYSDLLPEPPFGDPSGYGFRCVRQALDSGFTLLGWAGDLKGPMYRASYAMLVSKEKDIFALIGTGTIGKLPLTATWLHTPTAEGRSFYSTDKQAGVQIDLSRNWTNQLVPAKSFQRLLNEHREWIKKNAVLPRPFTPGRELAEFKALRENHFRSMERSGLIDFANDAASHFNFTLSGAAKTATWGYFLGMSRALSQGRFPRNA